ncbi:MAG: exopolysaccharide biosynthesis protein [Pseudomonadota bacterium]
MSDDKLVGLLDSIENASDDQKTSVDEILSALGHRSFGPILITLGLIAVSPVGSIPGASALIAVLTILIASQMVWGETQIWLPDRLRRISIDSSRLGQAVDRLKPTVRALSTITKPRLKQVFEPPVTHIASLAAIILALSMLPLVVIPGGVVPASLVVILLGVALVSSDGYLLIAALVLTCGTLLATAWVML